MNEQDKELAAGRDAAELLDHRAFKAARTHILEGIAAKRRSVPMNDAEMHTRLILLEQCWVAIERYLENARDTGLMVQFQVEAEEKKRNSVMDFVGRRLRA